MRSLLVNAILCSLVGCNASAVGHDGGGDGLIRVPLVHRPTAAPCPSDRPVSNCTSGGPTEDTPGYCTGDSECSDPNSGTNGRCVAAGHGWCACNYDRCTTDASCGDNQVCNCRTDAQVNAGANICVASNCRVDADCGDNYCSPSFDETCGKFFGVTSWRCHTRKDECIEHSDCEPLPGASATPFCAYFPEVGYWRCSYTQCAG